MGRRSIPEIGQVLYTLAKREKSEGHTKADRPTGLQYLYEDRFTGTLRHIEMLRKSMWAVVVLSFVSIVSAMASLALTDDIAESALRDALLWLNVVVFTAPLLAAGYLIGIALGRYRKTVHETDRTVGT